MHHQILVVEDDSAIRELVAMQLEYSDYEVFLAEDAFEAHRILDSQHIDLVITDQEMPQFTGEMLAAVLSHTHPDLPVVLLTGYSDYDDGPPSGIRSVIRKPFSLQVLRETLAALLPHVV